MKGLEMQEVPDAQGMHNPCTGHMQGSGGKARINHAVAKWRFTPGETDDRPTATKAEERSYGAMLRDLHELESWNEDRKLQGADHPARLARAGDDGADPAEEGAHHRRL